MKNLILILTVSLIFSGCARPQLKIAPVDKFSGQTLYTR